MTDPLPTRERFVDAAGVTLLVRDRGGPQGPHVVFVHGYPDDSSVWEPLVDALPDVHAVSYDVRGAGRSSRPRGRAAYRIEALTDDLVAVVEATVPAGERFHLVGHDWGSVQSWNHVVDPRLADRVASFVSISGPSLDHVALLLRRPGGRSPALLRQLRRSSYIWFFHLPVLPEAMWQRRLPGVGAVLRVLAGQGGAREWSPALARDATAGLALYRANVLPRLLRPRPQRVEVPVLLVEPSRDAFVRPQSSAGLERHCAELRRVSLDAPHYPQRTCPDLLVDVLREHLDRCEPGRQHA